MESNIDPKRNDSMDPIEILNELLQVLTEKEQAIIKRRYGINQNRETLASIGKDFNVTRERVRQLQTYSIKKLQRNAFRTKLVNLYKWADLILKESGDIISEKTFESQLKIKFPSNEKQVSELKLATVLFPEVTYEQNKINFVPHFRKATISMKTIQLICKRAIKILEVRKEPTSQNQLLSQIQDQFKNDERDIRKKLILAALKLDRRIKVKADSISLTKWRQFNPKTLYDKIAYVLRKAKRPLHFTEITNEIIKSNFDSKTVSQQAIHNELINREEFVLVGRGMYGLKEWGYTKGTVTDIIKEILQEKGPLPYQNLIENVLERRKVKHITVQININNRKFFHRDTNNIVSLI